MSTGERFLQTKCSPNTRMPLERRIAPIQGQSSRALRETPPSQSAFLPHRHPIESTYNSSLRSTVQSSVDCPPRAKVVEGGDPSSHCPPFMGVSNQRATFNAGLAEVPPEQLQFFSQVRKQEQLDWDAAHVAKKVRGSQLSVTTLEKREKAPEFLPPALNFSGLSGTRRAPSNPNRVAPPSAATSFDGFVLPMDDVRCTILVPQSTQFTEYVRPANCIPSELPSSYHVQRSVLSQCSSGNDMFLGTAKSHTGVVPLYVGHVPVNQRNRDKILGDADVLRPFCKSTVNLASSKGANSGVATLIRGDASIASTVMGFYSLQAVQSSAEEKGMNRRDPRA
jgi:hypothetical protein